MHHGRATTLEGISTHGSKTENTNPVGMDLCVPGHVQNAGEAHKTGHFTLSIARCTETLIPFETQMPSFEGYISKTKDSYLNLSVKISLFVV
jgi:hypothetical protein